MPGGKKPLLKNPVTWVVVLAGVLIVGGIILYRNMQANSASSSDTADSGDTGDGTDDSGALGTLQTEIGDLQSSAGQVVVPNVAGDTAAVATTVINGAGLSAANPGGTPGTNIVSGTSPAAGSSVASGTVVNISSAPAPKQANGTPVKTSGPVTPVSPTPPKTTTSQNEYSWTDTGQKETPTQLAKALGISVSALKPTNASAKKAVSQPTKDIPKGAKFTYVKAPKTVTTS